MSSAGWKMALKLRTGFGLRKRYLLATRALLLLKPSNLFAEDVCRPTQQHASSELQFRELSDAPFAHNFCRRSPYCGAGEFYIESATSEGSTRGGFQIAK